MKPTRAAILGAALARAARARPRQTGEGGLKITANRRPPATRRPRCEKHDQKNPVSGMLADPEPDRPRCPGAGTTEEDDAHDRDRS